MNVDILLDKAIEHWRQNKGIGTAIVPYSINDKYIISGILVKMYAISSSCKTLIVVPNFAERTDIMEFLTHQHNDAINNKFVNLLKLRHISIVTQDFTNTHPIKIPTLFIAYHIDSPIKSLNPYYQRSKFKLTVINKFLKDKEDMIELYKVCPLLDEFKPNEVSLVRLSTPVEEYRIGININLNSEDNKLLEYYDNYIATSLAIFGDFETIDKARIGNTKLNISAMQVCNELARENGWNEHLDMSNDFNIQLDKLYNPGNIKERASKTYEIIRNRGKFLANYKNKLECIYNIIKEHKNERILIINKYSEFANEVTEYINKQEGKVICGNYHDKIEPAYAIDINGNPILIKKGVHKGEPRILKAQAQRTNNELLFNKGAINILSTNNSPDKKLNINVDIIIITSPQCELIKSYLYRLSDIHIPNIIKLYTLYCVGTTEEKLLNERKLDKNHTIIENNDLDENNFDFVVAN